MTRKARCGKTQKHTKMPGDATPWEELSLDIKKNIGSIRGPPENKIKKECIKETHPIKKPENEYSPVTEKDSHSECLTNKTTKAKDHTSFKNKGKIDKKNFFMEKLQQRRLENGVTLLSPKQERKIYLIKKKLRQKDMPPDVIKGIIRKKRRSEEILFRKTFTTKTCFNCRERGHLLTDCPLRLGSTTQVTGICFKCGSTEHVSYRCQKKVEGYPLAKCFVCKEQGHISKDCPKNKHGVYIKGGSCNVCGNINHLQKDCPTLVKKKEEHPFHVYTINECTSIDAEIVEDATVTRKKMPKKPKVVKF